MSTSTVSILAEFEAAEIAKNHWPTPEEIYQRAEAERLESLARKAAQAEPDEPDEQQPKRGRPAKRRKPLRPCICGRSRTIIIREYPHLCVKCAAEANLAKLGKKTQCQ